MPVIFFVSGPRSPNFFAQSQRDRAW